MKGTRAILGLLAFGALANVGVAVACAVLAPLPVSLPRPTTLGILTPDDHRWLDRQDFRGAAPGPWYAHVWTYRHPGLERRLFETPAGVAFAQQVSAGWPVAWLEGGMVNLAPVKVARRAEWRSDAALPLANPASHAPVKLLPLRVAWGAFAATSLLYAAAPALLFGVFRLVRRVLRRRGDGCPACGYPRGSSERCTECGRVLA